MSLLQYRRAKWYKALVQLPGAADRRTKRNACGLPSPTEVLDLLQSKLAPVVLMLLWGLLMAGKLSRAWYYNTYMILSASCALRAFVAIATKRVRTIKRIAEIQKQAPGKIEDKRRRKRTLKAKTRGVIADLFLVFTGCFLTTISFVFSSSFFSSRRLILNYAIAYTVAVFTFMGGNMQLHNIVRNEEIRCARVYATTNALNSDTSGEELPKRTESDMSGMSVVEKTCINSHGQRRSMPSGGGLFSEVKTEEIS
jgi:hypothetical protein